MTNDEPCLLDACLYDTVRQAVRQACLYAQADKLPAAAQRRLVTNDEFGFAIFKLGMKVY